MKVFIVFMQICSNISSICSGYYSDDIEHKTYKECVLHGLKNSTKIIKEFDENVMNDERTIIKFHCLEQDSNKV